MKGCRNSAALVPAYEAVRRQAALLYTAYIETDASQPYALLELTGHGGGGEIQHDLGGFTTARRLVDLLLVKTMPAHGKIER